MSDKFIVNGMGGTHAYDLAIAVTTSDGVHQLRLGSLVEKWTATGQANIDFDPEFHKLLGNITEVSLDYIVNNRDNFYKIITNSEDRHTIFENMEVFSGQLDDLTITVTGTDFTPYVLSDWDNFLYITAMTDDIKHGITERTRNIIEQIKMM